MKDFFKDYPNFSDIWMKNGKTPNKGEVFKNKELANTYKKIASTYGRDFYKIVLPIKQALPDDVFFLYYPNEGEGQTRVTEFKKFTNHKSSNTLITMEVPSMKNKLYPTMIKNEVEKAEKYIDSLPKNVKSVGRMGTYKYVDIDDIILQGLEFKKNL